MSGRNGVIYIKLDVRGSKGQSTKDLFGRLGDIEVSDQILVIRYVENVQPGAIITRQVQNFS